MHYIQKCDRCKKECELTEINSLSIEIDGESPQSYHLCSNCLDAVNSVIINNKEPVKKNAGEIIGWMVYYTYKTKQKSYELFAISMYGKEAEKHAKHRVDAIVKSRSFNGVTVLEVGCYPVIVPERDALFSHYDLV